MSKKIDYAKIHVEQKTWGDVILEGLYVLSINYKDSPKNREAFFKILSSYSFLIPNPLYKKCFRDSLRAINFDKKYFDEKELLIEWTRKIVLRTAFCARKIHLNFDRKMFQQGKLFWGRKIWATMHLFSANIILSQENTQAFIDFITSLAYLLPCDECRGHYIKNLEEFPLRDKDFSSPENLYKWTFLLHSVVNKQLGKQNPRYEDTKRIWFLENS